MKCLVTGAAGFIGSHLCERLLHPDMPSSASMPSFPITPGPSRRPISPPLRGQARLHLSRSSTCAPIRWTSALEGVEVVFHLAAMPGLHTELDRLRPLRRAATSPPPSACSKRSTGFPGCAASCTCLHLLRLRPLRFRRRDAAHPAHLALRRDQAGRREPVPGLRRGARPAAGRAALLLRLRPPAAARHGLSPLHPGPAARRAGHGLRRRPCRCAATPTSTIASRATVAALEAPPGEIYNVGGGETAYVWDDPAKLETIIGRRPPSGASRLGRRPAVHRRRHRQAGPPSGLAARASASTKAWRARWNGRESRNKRRGSRATRRIKSERGEEQRLREEPWPG